MVHDFGFVWSLLGDAKISLLARSIWSSSEWSCLNGYPSLLDVTLASLKFNLIASRMKLMNYLIYFEGEIILYYGIYKENK